jgi:ribosomal protein S18 acetylase RimI-like enzyme
MADSRVEIVEMTIQDYDEVAGLWRNTEGVGLDEATDTREGIAAYLCRNPGLSYVARFEGRTIAAVLCGHDGRRGYLHHLAVAPAHRRKGIGRAAVEACLEKLGSLGIRRCNIFLFSDNEPGAEFWRRIGWGERADLRVLQKPTPSRPSRGLRGKPSA